MSFQHRRLLCIPSSYHLPLLLANEVAISNYCSQLGMIIRRGLLLWRRVKSVIVSAPVSQIATASCPLLTDGFLVKYIYIYTFFSDSFVQLKLKQRCWSFEKNLHILARKKKKKNHIWLHVCYLNEHGSRTANAYLKRFHVNMPQIW